MQTPTSAPKLIASVIEKLAHTPTSKATRLEVWTVCGKRVRTSTLVRISAAEATARGFAICGCGEAKS